MLQTRKGREGKQRFLAEGIRVVEDLLASPVEIVEAVTMTSLEDNQRGSDLVTRLRQRDIPVTQLDDRDFQEFADTESTQGVIVVARTPAADMAMIDGEGRGVVLVLDAVQDPGNFGTMIRSAEALGARGVIALPGTVDPWNAKSVRAAAGSSFRIPILQESGAILDHLRFAGFSILAADAGGDPDLSDPSERVALIVGNEGAGIAAELRTNADRTVAVPIRGRAESLNVAAATAILLYELCRSR